MTIDVKWELLDRYFSGDCSPDELEQVARWIADDPARARELAAVRRIWEESVPEGAAAIEESARFNAERAWDAVHRRIVAARQGDGGEAAARPRTRVLRLHPPHAAHHAAAAGLGGRRAWYRRWPLLAAAAGVVIAAGVAWMHSGAWHTAARTDALAQEYATGRGERTEIVLRDGTRVMLSVRSRFRVPAHYGAGARDVYLDGEAFFEVAHDAKRPFRVHAAGALAEDLGTAFVVRAYPGDSSATVVVAEGKVALRADAAGASRGVALVARQLGRLDASRLVSVESDVNVEQYLAWRQGRLVFRNTPLAQVAREVERWYDVDIAISDSALAAVPITGAFATPSADAVLGDIARLLDLRYSRHGRHARLAPRSGAR